MAYMRGEFYVWSDGENTHFNDFEMPDELLDAFVAMRWAQLTDEEKEAAEVLAVARYGGNFGCIELCEKRGVPSGLDMLETLVEQNTDRDRDARDPATRLTRDEQFEYDYQMGTTPDE